MKGYLVKIILAVAVNMSVFVGQSYAALTLTVDSYTTDEVTLTISGTLDADTTGTSPGWFAIKNDWSNNVGVHTEWFTAIPAVTQSLLVDGVPVIAANIRVQNDPTDGWTDNFAFAGAAGETVVAVAGTTVSGSITLTLAGAFDPTDEATLQLVTGWTDPAFQRLEAGVTAAPGPASPATAVPTMSAYGLVLTMLGLLLVASRRLRASAKRR